LPTDIYALLVGINDYSPGVGTLTGCLNDVDHFQNYLEDNFDRSRLRVVSLKDADPTRSNIIGPSGIIVGRDLVRRSGRGCRLDDWQRPEIISVIDSPLASTTFDTIVNLKLGLRWTTDHDSIYVGSGHAFNGRRLVPEPRPSRIRNPILSRRLS